MCLSHCTAPSPSASPTAQTAAHKLWKIIDLRPEIDAYADSGAKPAPASLTGSIEFRCVAGLMR